jgi:flavin-dependent dehydrogenase
MKDSRKGQPTLQKMADPDTHPIASRAPIAIIGGGPAGARTAELLASAGVSVTVFEEKQGWEKPCGGGLTHKTLLRYPFLAAATHPHAVIAEGELISPAGRRLHLHLTDPTLIYSRRDLNALLLDRAQRAGAEVVTRRVTRISGSAGAWQLHTPDSTFDAPFVIVAAGARNPFRAQFTQPFAPGDLMTAVGYFIPGTARKLTVRFFPDLEGYAWLFPRSDHFSAGICGRLAQGSTADLRRILENFLDAENLDWRSGSVYAHLIPTLRTSTLEHAAFSGPGWAFTGDAAGFVDPVTGEGLYYALCSADLLADSLLGGQPESYPDLVRGDFLPDLIAASRYAERFYHGKFWGGTVIERMLQMAARSTTMRGLLQDLFAGSQSYLDLRGRVRSALPRVVRECVLGQFSLFRARTDPAQA